MFDPLSSCSLESEKARLRAVPSSSTCSANMSFPCGPGHHRHPPYALLYWSAVQGRLLHLKFTQGRAAQAIIRCLWSDFHFRCDSWAQGDAS